MREVVPGMSQYHSLRGSLSDNSSGERSLRLSHERQGENPEREYGIMTRDMRSGTQVPHYLLCILGKLLNLSVA